MALQANVCHSDSGMVLGMGLRQTLKKAMAYLLGVVDEYWAMREPSQYGDRDPECSIALENESRVSERARQ